uniref:hypothetical protein n=1 Tax=uncultured Allisonella sp. TaxID=339338 RepID=UPI002591C5D9|nr:hypothetical protein [uncultured Allisonella sp.]
MAAEGGRRRCYFCGRDLSDRALMWTKVYDRLVPCHRNCENVWFFNEYGNQVGGCYNLPDRLPGFDWYVQRRKHG